MQLRCDRQWVGPFIPVDLDNPADETSVWQMADMKHQRRSSVVAANLARHGDHTRDDLDRTGLVRLPGTAGWGPRRSLLRLEPRRVSGLSG